MKKIISTLFCILIFIACAEETVDNTPPVVVVPPPVIDPWKAPAPANCGYNPAMADTEGWKSVWSDEFDGELNKWIVWRGGAFNNELQLYQSKNLVVQNGYLYIRGIREKVSGLENPYSSNNKNFDFSSGRIESVDTFGASNAQAIKMVARIQQPAGEGLWTAFWSYNDPWPTAGEIDIMEYRGNSPTKMETCYHYGRQVDALETNANINSFKYDLPSGEKSFSECFYVYELDWYPDRFEMKINGKVIKTYQEPQHAFISAFNNKKHRVILNMAIGGNFFSNLNTSKIPNESVMIVDWVKVYTK